MCLIVWFEPDETSDLHRTCVNDSGTNKVFRVGIDSLEERESVANQFRLGLSVVHGEGGLEDLLILLTGTEREDIIRRGEKKKKKNILTCLDSSI